MSCRTLFRLFPWTRLALVALPLAVATCGDDGPVDPTDLTFHPDLGVDLSAMTRTASGLYVLDEEVGEGQTAMSGDSVTVHYTGWLHSGRQFDTSRDGGPPFGVWLGQGALIAGWEEGLLGMREGGHRLLVIPSQLAWGASGAGGGAIPPHATVVFRVELLNVHREED